VIVGCATEPENIMPCGQYCYPIDLAIALDHMSLAATAEGLGSCWMGHSRRIGKGDIGDPGEDTGVSMLILAIRQSLLLPDSKKLEEIVLR